MTDLSIPRFEDIAVGSVYSFEHVFSSHDEDLFAELTGDRSVLTNKRSERLVHGMLAASFFSTLVDNYCPGPMSLYLSQTLRFKKAIVYGANILIKGTVTNKSDSTRIITLRTEMISANEVLVEGDALVQVIGENVSA